MDTYKVATVANSCSTMHKLATTPITKENFSFDEFDIDMSHEPIRGPWDESCRFDDDVDIVITMCEYYRKKYLETKDIRYWRALIQLLPESWNQKRTWTADYAVARNIHFAREFHKLSEWREFDAMLKTLPYAEELITIQKEQNNG